MESDLRAGMRAAVRGLWNGTLDGFGFIDVASAAIYRAFTQEYYRQVEACGLTAADLTVDERQMLMTEIYSQFNYLGGFANDVIAHSKVMRGKLTPHFNRIEMWVGRLGYIRSVAKSTACADLKYEWVYGHTKIHCGSCKRMSGRVYRGRVWRKYGIAPRARDLECRGYNCLCELIPTSKAVTPGRPPLL